MACGYCGAVGCSVGEVGSGFGLLDKLGNVIKEYASVNECVEENPNLSSSQINRVLKNTIKSHKGYCFKYKDEDIV